MQGRFWRVRGADIISAAKELVLAELRSHPEGLTNVEVGRKTGLHLDIEKQTGYIQWTILQHLIEEGRVRKQGRGPGARYVVVKQTT
jgi:hypothetical protein